MSDSNFFQDVYDVVRLIPAGRVTTYGAIARYLGAARSSRMVGWAMNASHTQPDIPAHRVVNRQGMLTGKMMFAYPMQMQELLELEGVLVKDDRIVDFKRIFWVPQ
jgi:methylated-DNA-protein-cysteine methyltransferase-like protein